jgi:hypothetical protein
MNKSWFSLCMHHWSRRFSPLKGVSSIFSCVGHRKNH